MYRGYLKLYETENDENEKVAQKSTSKSKKKKTVIETDKSKPSDPLTSTCGGGGEGGRLDLEGLILGWLCKKRRNRNTEWGIWGTLWVVVVWGK